MPGFTKIRCVEYIYSGGGGVLLDQKGGLSLGLGDDCSGTSVLYAPFRRLVLSPDCIILP